MTVNVTAMSDIDRQSVVKWVSADGWNLAAWLPPDPTQERLNLIVVDSDGAAAVRTDDQGGTCVVDSAAAR